LLRFFVVGPAIVSELDRLVYATGVGGRRERDDTGQGRESEGAVPQRSAREPM
jgi:hypothetical protein